MKKRSREHVRSRTGMYCLLASIGTFVAVFVVDASLARLGYRLEATLLDNLLLALLVGILVFSLQSQHERELRRQKQKNELLADMNHHVRNALQTIVYINFQNPDTTAAEKVAEAATRIEWALREILPGNSTIATDENRDSEKHKTLED